MNTVFTTITNRYDDLKPPRVISEGWEYIAFMDEFVDVPPWQCIVTQKSNRELKILACEMFHNLTLYIDGSIEIRGDLNEFIKEVPHRYSVLRHPHRDSVKDEAKAVIKLKGISSEIVQKQLSQYKGFPDNMGLAACGVLLRDLSDPDVRRVNRIWWDGFVYQSGRDQLNFMQSCWLAGVEPYLFSSEVFNKYFKLHKHTK